MINNSALRFLYRSVRKLLYFETQIIRKILSISNRARVNYHCPDFRIPMCASTAFSSVFWARSWKTDLIERLVRPDLGAFVDVGANVGQTLLDLLVVFPKARYIGFEPNVACAFYLKALILENSFNNCLIVPSALANQGGCLPLYLEANSPNDQGATIVSDLRPDLVTDIDYISCFRFDDIRLSLNIENIDFVKIDVEGSELETLKGMTESLRKFRPTVLCEVLFTDTNASLEDHAERNTRLIYFLRDLNYSILQIIKSQDNTKVIDVKKTKFFVSAYWTSENKDLCDYLFVPIEKIDNSITSLTQTK